MASTNRRHTSGELGFAPQPAPLSAESSTQGAGKKKSKKVATLMPSLAGQQIDFKKLSQERSNLAAVGGPQIPSLYVAMSMRGSTNTRISPHSSSGAPLRQSSCGSGGSGQLSRLSADSELGPTTDQRSPEAAPAPARRVSNCGAPLPIPRSPQPRPPAAAKPAFSPQAQGAATPFADPGSQPSPRPESSKELKPAPPAGAPLVVNEAMLTEAIAGISFDDDLVCASPQGRDKAGGQQPQAEQNASSQQVQAGGQGRAEPDQPQGQGNAQKQQGRGLQLVRQQSPSVTSDDDDDDDDDAAGNDKGSSSSGKGQGSSAAAPAANRINALPKTGGQWASTSQLPIAPLDVPTSPGPAHDPATRSPRQARTSDPGTGPRTAAATSSASSPTTPFRQAHALVPTIRSFRRLASVSRPSSGWGEDDTSDDEEQESREAREGNLTGGGAEDDAGMPVDASATAPVAQATPGGRPGDGDRSSPQGLGASVPGLPTRTLGGLGSVSLSKHSQALTQVLQKVNEFARRSLPGEVLAGVQGKQRAVAFSSSGTVQQLGILESQDSESLDISDVPGDEELVCDAASLAPPSTGRGGKVVDAKKPTSSTKKPSSTPQAPRSSRSAQPATAAQPILKKPRASHQTAAGALPPPVPPSPTNPSHPAGPSPPSHPAPLSPSVTGRSRFGKSTSCKERSTAHFKEPAMAPASSVTAPPVPPRTSGGPTFRRSVTFGPTTDSPTTEQQQPIASKKSMPEVVADAFELLRGGK